MTADVSGILPVANGGTGGSSLPFSGLFKSGTTTKNAADASTTQTIAHGLAQAPKYVEIIMTCLISASTGTFAQATSVYNGSVQSSQSVYISNSTALPANDSSFKLNNGGGSPGDNSAGVITFDATNISIAWTKTGAPTGTYQLLWKAFS